MGGFSFFGKKIKIAIVENYIRQNVIEVKYNIFCFVKAINSNQITLIICLQINLINIITVSLINPL